MSDASDKSGIILQNVSRDMGHRVSGHPLITKISQLIFFDAVKMRGRLSCRVCRGIRIFSPELKRGFKEDRRRNPIPIRDRVKV